MSGAAAMSGAPLELNREVCQACSTITSRWGMRSFVDDGETYFVCLDTDACEMRRAGRVESTAAAARQILLGLMAELDENWRDLGDPGRYRSLLQRLRVMDQILARVEAHPGGTVEASFVMPAMNRLMARVEALEAWRRGLELPGLLDGSEAD